MNAPTQASPAHNSPYSADPHPSDRVEQHTLSVLVDNEPGVLARVIGLFSGRGYNIDSLTVSETIHEKHLSRITIITTGSPMVIEQIRNQLDRLVPVHGVTDLTVLGEPISRELAFIKVVGKGDKRSEALRIAEAAPMTATHRRHDRCLGHLQTGISHVTWGVTKGVTLTVT